MRRTTTVASTARPVATTPAVPPTAVPPTATSPGRRRRGAGALAAGLAVGLALTGCVASQRDPAQASGAKGGGTFVFAASADPVMLDPAFASDGETFRVSRQIFEGLVGTKPGTADPAPLLATSWKTAADGLSTTFDLRKGVRFSDGTTFDATAVCANFERWYGWTGVNQSPNLSYYYGKLFGGFKDGADASKQGIYGGCDAKDATTATITLKKPFAGLVASMSLPAFAMQSPTAMKKYDADGTSGGEDDPRFSPYATAHPTGTGPFVLGAWDRGQSVTLKRNEKYWGDKAKIDTAVIRTISDGNARLQALKAGDIDGYDLVAPGDLAGLKDAGFAIEQRAPFNVLYLGFNQKVPALADVRVRQAIAHAIDRKAIISQSLPAGTVAAQEFMPDLVTGFTQDVTTYDYDPAKAKELLAQAGQSNLELTFNYPTGVSRPYMPSPEDTFLAVQSQLQAVGIKVTPQADAWSDYLDRINGSADHGIHLLGWTGDYDDSDNFIGTFFGQQSPEWGFDDPQLFSDLAAAKGLATQAEQEPAYEKLNREISDFVPGVPLASPVPSLAFAKGVKGYRTSPVQDEVWNAVTVSKG